MIYTERKPQKSVYSDPVSPFIFHTPAVEDFRLFAVERMDRYHFRRDITKKFTPRQLDPILDGYKFTNAYRILDRVTQFEIEHVVDGEFANEQSHAAAIFIFRTLNSVETYAAIPAELLYRAFAGRGQIFKHLNEYKSKGNVIFGNAYLMPSGHTEGYTSRLDFFEAMLEQLIASGDLMALYNSSVIEFSFDILRKYKGMGDFLAYQYALDYSYRHKHVDYDSFIVPGVGCVRGMKKVFPGITRKEMPAVLSALTEFGMGPSFRPLEVDGQVFPLRGNDVQNLFCEYDKYTRVLRKEGRMKAHFDHPYRTLPEPVIPRAWR